MKILIMKFRNIGDVLLTTPLVDAISSAYPGAIIDFACNAGTQAMIEGNENIRKIHVYEREKLRKKGLFGRIFGELKFIHSIKKEKYDIAIQTTSGDRGIIIARYAKAKKIVSFLPKNRALARFVTHPIIAQEFPKPQRDGLDLKDSVLPSQVLEANLEKPRPLHTIERNLLALTALNLKIPAQKAVRILFSKGLLDGFDLPKRFVHFHITSRWMFKCAKDELMAELIDFCEENLGVKVVISGDGSDVESAKISRVLELCKSKPLNLNGKLSLKQTAELASKAKCFVGVDTAIMHIAAAVDTPVVALFGPSGAFEWGPWDNALFQNGYIKRNGIQQMGKHIVFQKEWTCVPCGKDGCNSTKISRCLMEFDKGEIEAIKERIRLNINL